VRIKQAQDQEIKKLQHYNLSQTMNVISGDSTDRRDRLVVGGIDSKTSFPGSRPEMTFVVCL